MADPIETLLASLQLASSNQGQMGNLAQNQQQLALLGRQQDEAEAMGELQRFAAQMTLDRRGRIEGMEQEVIEGLPMARGANNPDDPYGSSFDPSSGANELLQNFAGLRLLQGAGAGEMAAFADPSLNPIEAFSKITQIAGGLKTDAKTDALLDFDRDRFDFKKEVDRGRLSFDKLVHGDNVYFKGQDMNLRRYVAENQIKLGFEDNYLRRVIAASDRDLNLKRIGLQRDSLELEGDRITLANQQAVDGALRQWKELLPDLNIDRTQLPANPTLEDLTNAVVTQSGGLDQMTLPAKQLAVSAYATAAQLQTSVAIAKLNALKDQMVANAQLKGTLAVERAKFMELAINQEEARMTAMNEALKSAASLANAATDGADKGLSGGAIDDILSGVTNSLNVARNLGRSLDFLKDDAPGPTGDFSQTGGTLFSDPGASQLVTPLEGMTQEELIEAVNESGDPRAASRLLGLGAWEQPKGLPMVGAQTDSPEVDTFLQQLYQTGLIRSPEEMERAQAVGAPPGLDPERLGTSDSSLPLSQPSAQPSTGTSEAPPDPLEFDEERAPSGAMRLLVEGGDEEWTNPILVEQGYRDLLKQMKMAPRAIDNLVELGKERGNLHVSFRHYAERFAPKLAASMQRFYQRNQQQLLNEAPGPMTGTVY